MDDLTEASITAFLTSSYAVSASNEAFKRLHKLMFVQIPMALCVGDNGLSRVDKNDGGKCTWELYNTEYSPNLEAMVVFMFREQIDFLTKLEDQDNTSQSDNSTTVSVDGLKKKGGRPKNKKTFCPIEHHKYKHNVLHRRDKASNWFGWYDAAIKSIRDKNKENLDEMQKGISALTPQDSQGQEGFGQQEEVDPQDSVAYNKQVEKEVEMYRRRQESKNGNKKAKSSDDGSSISNNSSSSNSLQADGTEMTPLTAEEQLKQLLESDKENAVLLARQLLWDHANEEV
jgi:hypothetical protein